MNFRALFDTPIMALVLPLLLVMVAGLLALMIRGMIQMQRSKNGRTMKDSRTTDDKSTAKKCLRRAA